MNVFLNDTATTEIYTYGHTLSLHDAHPILVTAGTSILRAANGPVRFRFRRRGGSPLPPGARPAAGCAGERSEEHTSELQSLMRISYAVFCLSKKITLPFHLYFSLSTLLLFSFFSLFFFFISLFSLFL